MKKAYDKAWHYKILKKLHSIEVGGHLAYFSINPPNNRKFNVRINNTYSKLCQIENGVPQESVLSTILFILSINSVHKIVSRPISLRIFVDDISISFRCNNIEIAQLVIQETLSNRKMSRKKWAKLFGVQDSLHFTFQKIQHTKTHPQTHRTHP